MVKLSSSIMFVCFRTHLDAFVSVSSRLGAFWTFTYLWLVMICLNIFRNSPDADALVWKIQTSVDVLHHLLINKTKLRKAKPPRCKAAA